MSQSDIKSFLERIKTPLIIAGSVAVGAVLTALIIQYRNGIGLNELIYSADAEELRKNLEPGSPYLITNGYGVEKYITKVHR